MTMTIIKSYTDISQSKNLSKILPLESADMLFQLGEDKYADSIRVPLTKEHWEQMMPDINPCWSLAALLDVLPKQIHNNGLWWLQIDYIYNSVSYMGKDNSVLHYVLMDSDKSLVDACYEMIIKLNELKML